MMLVFLTEAGRDQIKSIRKSQRKTEKAAFAGLKKKEVAELLRLLTAVDANISETLRPDTVSASDPAAAADAEVPLAEEPSADGDAGEVVA